MNQQRTNPEIPSSVNVKRRIWWLTLLKAADKSNNNRPEDCPPALAEHGDSVTHRSAISVE